VHEYPKLPLIESFDLDVPEPSGLTLNADRTALYVVSDPPDNGIYKISLEGELLVKFDYRGVDLEGIAYDLRDSTLWVIEETQYKLIHLDTTGKEIGYYSTDFTGDHQNGLEGICYNQSVHSLVLINEKKPRVLIILDSLFSESKPLQMDFADDFSGICHDDSTGNYLIVSDESEQLIIINFASDEIEKYRLEIPKAEGVAYDPKKKLVYIVSDSKEKLYVFSLEL